MIEYYATCTYAGKEVGRRKQFMALNDRSALISVIQSLRYSPPPAGATSDVKVSIYVRDDDRLVETLDLNQPLPDMVERAEPTTSLGRVNYRAENAKAYLIACDEEGVSPDSAMYLRILMGVTVLP